MAQVIRAGVEREGAVEDWQRLLVAVFDLAGGSTNEGVDAIAAGNRAGLGYPDPRLRSEEFDAAARYFKENRLVTGHTALRLTAAGAEEAGRLKG